MSNLPKPNSGHGWIKLWRSLLDHELWTDCPKDWFRIALACLLMANYKPKVWHDGGKEVLVGAGSFVTSLDKLARKTRCTREQVRNTLVQLERTQFITQQTTHRYRLITIVNWDTYQGTEDVEEHSDQHSRDTQKNTVLLVNGTPTKEERTHHQEGKKKNSDERASALRKAPGIVEEDFSQIDDDEPEVYTDPLGEFRRRLHERHPGAEIEAITDYVRKELDTSTTTWADFLSIDKAKTTGRVTNPPGYYRALARELVRSGVHAVSRKRFEDLLRDSQQRESDSHERAKADALAKCGECDTVTGLLPTGEPCSCKRGEFARIIATDRNATQ